MSNMASRGPNPDIFNKFIKKLDSLTCSDYYGVSSPGLTCYLNCVIQVLFFTKDFREAVTRSSKSKKSSSSVIDSVLAELFYELQSRTAKTDVLIKRLGISEVWEQRDAAEYLERVLSLSSEEASQMFKGDVSHVTVCRQCQKRNQSSNSFWMLPLAMEDTSHHHSYNVKEGVDAFFQVHSVCGENQVYCKQCSDKRDADIKWEMGRHPGVLTLLLKRFTFNDRLRHYDKLYCNASVPQRLQVEGCTYDLYAIISHLGSLTGGHYTAEIKSFETNNWYRFDDGVVKTIIKRDSSFSSSSAYLLLYRKGSKEPDVMRGRSQQRDHYERRDVSKTPNAPQQQPNKNDDYSKFLNGFLSEDVKHKQEKISDEGVQRRTNVRRRTSSLPSRDPTYTRSEEENRKPPISSKTHGELLKKALEVPRTVAVRRPDKPHWK
ncbi:ubiquitin carboxyl-terminal hydrolase 46-like [Gouania willdenowi]|uniref:Ubiquitin carboxyl-terminal hydrolase 46-like n=1 Tax=Gouania willdenowi TaxID=441366 RepID=A0A8C5EWH4_GOUWI|nr:ubiquitin carboxyl-terminal hydrolase 46-like [Gouania willdenowi]